MPNTRNTPSVLIALSLLAALPCQADEPPSVDAAVLAEESDPLWLLPGAERFPVDLELRMLETLEGRGADYTPRTRHVWENGSPKYTNRLILETSPYLLQHAHNPVNWYPWGDEAFETARRLGRPVLLSIGYSTCHWCHVMEEESFEDEEIAAYLNANYIAIKVDREERPDIDGIYMSAVQMLTGRGGWPMTTWLTPDRAPFYGGTYFPPRDGARGQRTGFLTLLRQLRTQYDRNPAGIVESATSLAERIRAQMKPQAGDTLPAATVLTAAAEGYSALFDEQYGGLDRAPKFPSSLPMRYLLRYHRRSEEPRYLDMATLTLRKMAEGGMYDQVGGGFHRYSVDARWLVPHFEKMLYDNALLTVAYLEAYQSTADEGFAAVARDVLDYVGREMTAPGGGFYSATDADSLTPAGHREEGWFFTWTPAELEAVLGADDARCAAAYWNVRPGGNFEGRSILNVTESRARVAAALEMAPAAFDACLSRARDALYRTRGSRPAPLRDDKLLTSWNGLMISAFAFGGFVLDRPDYTDRARTAATFVLENLRADGRLSRSFMDGQARHRAYLDDYAFLIEGLLGLFEATGEVKWLDEAVALQRTLDRHYADATGGGYFMTADDHESLLAREKPSYDGAEPSGNSVALLNLLRLYELTTDSRYLERAEALLRGFGKALTRSPRAFSEMLLAVDFWLDEAKEVVIVTTKSDDGAALVDALRRTYAPNKVVIVIRQDDVDALAKRIPLVKGKRARKGQATAYVCEGGLCQLPTSDADTFVSQLIARPASTSVPRGVHLTPKKTVFSVASSRKTR